MDLRIGRERNSDDLWSQIIADETHDHQPYINHQNQPLIAVTYSRKCSDATNKQPNSRMCGSSSSGSFNEENRASFGGANNNNKQRVSWSRSLSTRGRISIAVVSFADHQPQQQKPRRRKPPLPKGKVVQPPNFEKERAYFQEVDSYELMEESPSPKKCAWLVGVEENIAAVPPLCTRLEKWLNAKKRHEIPSSSLSNILRNSTAPLEPIPYDDSNSSAIRTPMEDYPNSHQTSSTRQNTLAIPEEAVVDLEHSDKEDFEDMESEIRKLSLAPRSSSLGGDQRDPFLELLKECGQSAPSTLLDVFSKFCDPEKIIKVGEGTYGEAFIAGRTVCKIVPIDGDLRVNGEVQKRSVELLEEVILSRTLNRLRASEVDTDNATNTFIETKDLRVCQGPYDPALIKAWEDWDAKHGSENDHPGQFPDRQCYVVFVLEHGGTDLESFVLFNFNEARSLLVQVTFALAVAEAAYEFEHRDLHWGNILLSRKDITSVQFTLEGKTMFIKTFGVSISIIDFTLSRINTGNTILYLDLSSDPEIFEGPKGDKQSETYRKMREVTHECWEGSYPKTNVLWLQYLVDMLLLKKSFEHSGKDLREMRAFKKRLNEYNSARATVSDPFFSDLLLHHPI